MEQSTHERWWQLHVRTAKGEDLDPGERETYEAGLSDLDADEKKQMKNGDLLMLRRLKSEVENLETTNAQLQARTHRLDRQIWTLEGACMALMGLELSSLDNAPSPV